MNKLNININKDDQNINDFLYCWSEMGVRPSKIQLFKNFIVEDFIEYFENKFTDKSSQKDIFDYEINDIINERFFSKISDKVWIGFTHFDILNDVSFIGEVVIYYDPQYKELVDEILEDILEFVIDEESNQTGSSESNLYSMTIGQNGFDSEKILINSESFENIEYFYNNHVLSNVNKLEKKIKKTTKGLTIIWGQRGCGKTTLLKYLSHKIPTKNFYFIPSTLFDLTINTPDFRNFIKKRKDSVFILDDCEVYFSDSYNKSNIFSTNLIQLVDGLDSDELAINIIVCLNCEKESDIDISLFETSSLIDSIEIDYLEKDKILELNKHLGKKTKIKQPSKLSDVLRNKIDKKTISEIGFD